MEDYVYKYLVRNIFFIILTLTLSLIYPFSCQKYLSEDKNELTS